MMNNKQHPGFVMNKVLVNHHYALLNIRNIQNFSEGIHKTLSSSAASGQCWGQSWTELSTELRVVLCHLYAGRTQFTVCAVIHCKISILLRP